MTHYEITLMLDKQFSYKDRLNLYREIVSEALRQGGVVIKLQFLGMQNIFNNEKNIKNKEKAKYALVGLKVNPKTLKNIEKIIKRNDNINRYLVVSV